ncbi:hypothetical protein [Aliterella atlantica]|uniref:Transposase n=1 Tax=Aliterella atlantica CENA595 TaxID=1618023 RepID=A0A0D8ZX33_9CYAN|nr:hypothetical protein [Aliterella atlantica]KJH71771.1 hypothetical protein UH38_10270 [Aliterella atlantica CENA595]
MTGKKISESVKNDIIHLYRHTGETTSTLADRYGVSNSTISRLLKSTLAEDEYEVLIASKRAARVPGVDGAKPTPEPQEPEIVVAAEPELEIVPSPPKRQRRSAKSTPQVESQPLIAEIEQVVPAVERENSTPVLPKKKIIPNPVPIGGEPLPRIEEAQLEEVDRAEPYDEVTNAENSALVAQMLGEDLLDEADDNEELDEDEDLDYLDDEDDEPETPVLVKRRSASGALVQVLPLSEATLPRTCYLVIDRASELITRPLREFGDLGQIPAQEVHQKTLPIFDNHRVARRFSTKRDRVIKIPDSRMLQKARYHLQAKGITRLLVDGQVYSLYLN